MAAVQVVHAFEDVAMVLSCALELGMVIQVDAPAERPEQALVSSEVLPRLGHGVFVLYRPDWVFGSPVFVEVSGGLNAGKFFQKPRVNVAPITASFSGERQEGLVSRLGSGTISRHADWLCSVDQTLQSSPVAVKSVYDALIKKVDTRHRLRGGGHNFIVLEHAWRKLSNGLAQPPFDYLKRSS